MSNTISLDSWLGLAEQNNSITVNLAEPEIRNIHQQKILVTDSTIFIHIHEPFYSAGKQYGWQINNPVGIGLSQELVDFTHHRNLRLAIIVGAHMDRYYQCSPSEVLEFAMDTDSIDYRGNVRLLIYPWQLCKTINEDVGRIIQLLGEVV